MVVADFMQVQTSQKELTCAPFPPNRASDGIFSCSSPVLVAREISAHPICPHIERNILCFPL